MNEQTSISLSTSFSGSIECGESAVDHIALSSEIQNESLASFVQNLTLRKGDLSWARLIEWFVEAAIGVELFRKHDPSAPPLSFENIQIDGSSTILIDPSSTEQEPPSISGSLASDLSTISSFFLDIHRTLNQSKRLILPLDDHVGVVCSRIMVALLEHFIASGDIILPDSSPHDYFPYFLEFYNDCIEHHPRTLFHLTNSLARLFCVFVDSHSKRRDFVLTPHSFLLGAQAETSEKLLEVVDKVKETHSLEVVRNLHFDWKEWVTMMEMVEQGVTALTDLSFLQSRCFRPTLEALQVKHQHIIKPPQNEESSRAESSSEDLHSEQFPMPFRFKGSQHSLSTISTETQLPSQHSSSSSDSQHSSSSSDTQILSSPQPHQRNQHPLRKASSIHSHAILTVIHSLLSKPPIDSFPWILRTGLIPEKELEIAATFSRGPVSLDERFGPSLFDEPDDTKITESLARCWEVIRTTQSLQCIDDLDSFGTLVIQNLHSSPQIIAAFCYKLFIHLTHLLPVLDPRAGQFRTLRTAFRDGTQIEQQALLYLWRIWLHSRPIDRNEQKMRVADFDFDGFMAADMTDTQLFDEACQFVIVLISSNNASITEQWKSDFILQFEKKNRMLDRLAGRQGPWTNERKSTLTRTTTHIYIAEMMSVFHGFAFPSELAELITIDLNSSPHRYERFINPAVFLNHTSIAPKHRHFFFPMDLMFERYVRDNPIAFFQNPQPHRTLFRERWFLHSPMVGLHSLFVRSIPLSLTQTTLSFLLTYVVGFEDRHVLFNEFHDLYSAFPPPRLLDRLLSSSRLVKADIFIWSRYLVHVWSLCESVAPFGECSSLAKVFKMLAPFDSNLDEHEKNMFSKVGTVVVFLHWLNIPAHFDSPLICHLHSLAGAQRGVLQTLSSHSGIPSLVAPLTSESISDSINHIAPDNDSMNKKVALLIMLVRSIQFPIFYPSLVELTHNVLIPRFLLSHTPAIASAAFEFYHRFVRFSSDAVRMKLVRFGLLDHIVFAVSCSSFLDDYEKGVDVIGILLDTIRRDHLRRRMRVFDFSRGLNRHSGGSSSL
ncbi:hypothetical protein BLNAU_13864 [Blattamonas nauphoetae]|uniref:Uncharacterized protein n=1 Tax=Blattamonas nauphoetae TaxID=2049346 RepID=A0ABQ9XFJ8_9EUKA|nr:hypothetical protein BLNAU_13864 [Blattamonas nauphoetae]